MDSLTQIVLGAAVAEAALGKKIGNRAMVWGAIAGTLPDLDVISNGFMSPIDALAFHRGPTHSALYLFISSFILGWLVHKMYQSPYHKWFGIVGWTILMGGIAITIMTFGTFSWMKISISLVVLLGSVMTIYFRYARQDYSPPQATQKDWTILFLWALITHPILDCFTTYGTQILLPFSNQRVAFNNIAVVDPAYTLPFMVCLLIAMFYSKNDHQRSVWNRRGLIISCMYMAFTLMNKTRINTIFENTLKSEGIEAKRFITTPTLLNNVLWNGIAETDSMYYYGTYSFFDEEKVFTLKSLPKARIENPGAIENDHTLKILKWFSDDFYNIVEADRNTFHFFDLRFGTFQIKSSEPDQFVFKFNLAKTPSGLFILKSQGDRPRDANFKSVIGALWSRILGSKPG